MATTNENSTQDEEFVSVEHTPESSPEKENETDAPKRDHLLQWMEISVSEPEKRAGSSSMKMQDTYIVYLVESKVTDPDMPGYGDPPTSVWRRYSEFELLKNYLEITFPAIIIPALPEKRVTHTWQKLPTDRFDPDFIERRRVGLENFMLRVASHTMLSKDRIFISFLRLEDGWKERVYSTDFQNKADSKLKALSASYRLKKPDRRFEELKNYSNELQTNITSILKIRARLADRLYGIHRIHSNYARVFNEWSSIEREMAEGLKSGGHYMEVFSSLVDGILEDEETFADQLKEYYSFGDSLRSVCRKQELLQLELEKCEDTLQYKEQQRDALAAGKTGGFSLSGMKTKLFGGDTPEQREQKLKQLNEQITESEEQVKVAEGDVQAFTEVSLRDVDRFKRQKTKDLKEIFMNFAVMEIDRCKKSIECWQRMRDSFART